MSLRIFARIRSFQLIRRLPELGTIPRGYGLAYPEPLYHRYVCLPLGLNVLARWCRTVNHWFIKTYKRTALDDMYYVGYSHGRMAGHRAGFKTGYAAAVDQLTRAAGHHPDCVHEHTP